VDDAEAVIQARRADGAVPHGAPGDAGQHFFPPLHNELLGHDGQQHGWQWRHVVAAARQVLHRADDGRFVASILVVPRGFRLIAPQTGVIACMETHVAGEQRSQSARRRDGSA